jgi:diguanylate cyclase (GGDEF)-like protein
VNNASRAIAAASGPGGADASRVRGWRAGAWRWALAGSTAAFAAYPFAPEGVRVALYHALGLGAVAAILAGVRMHRLPRPLPWLLLAGGQLLFAAGDIAWDVYDLVLRAPPSPSVADVLYLSGYPVAAAGLAVLGRRRVAGADAAGLIDASIVTIGAAVVAWVFLIAPYTTDAALSAPGRLTAIAYVLGDLLLLGMASRLFLVPGAGSRGQWLLGGGLLVVLVTDALYAGFSLAGTGPAERFIDVGWLAGYALISAAVLDPTIRALAEPAASPRAELSAVRLAMLATAALLAPGTLAIQTLDGAEADGLLIAGTSAAVFLLVILRMSGLVRRVEEQATQLARVARTDALTGVPNRRGWDEQLGVELARAGRTDTPVCIALLDLDHFKAFNDRHGHPAGDQLLREVAMAWRTELRSMDVLARYGGEEFGLILPGCGPEKAATIVDRLRALTPSGQTTSAGVVCWSGTESAEALVAQADLALYEAKRGGRDRTVVAGRIALAGAA